MDKLKMHSVNKVDENIKKIARLFPNTLTEVIRGYDKDGKPIVTHAIDFDVLRQELSDIMVEGPEERYQFTWPEKKKSIHLANAPVAKTLRPCREESVDFDTTGNLYFEGDNLDTLKLLQETYIGRIKMIYIDPPYNTGKNFIYEDNFAQKAGEYLATSGQYDEDGNHLAQNTEIYGRFHTDWLNMMYPRLKLAKDLLSEDGVIFISIDDNEVENLKKICNEIFGEENFIACFTWVKKKKGSHLSRTIRNMIEYVLLYGKNALNIELFGEKAYSDKWQPLAKRTNAPKTLVFPANKVETTLHDGVYKAGIYGAGTSSLRFETDITVKNNVIVDQIIVTGPFVWTQQKLDKEIKSGTRISLSSKFGFNVFRADQDEKVKRPVDILDSKLGIGTNEDAYQELISIFNAEKIMDYPKPVSLLKYLINTIGYFDNEFTVLDFFSGSATTAHAVMQLNAEDGGSRKFIMVQLPEACDETSEAYKKGYRTIADIGKERIRRAGKRILQEHPEAAGWLDTGFRVLKVDSTNMERIFYSPDEYPRDLLHCLPDNIKPDRTPEDLLFQVMLDLGVLPSSKIEEVILSGKRVFNVADGYLMACFDNEVTDELIREIAKKRPCYAVFRDSVIAADRIAANLEQIFETHSPSTIRKVL